MLNKPGSYVDPSGYKPARGVLWSGITAAGGAIAIDGPLPIGDIIGLGIFTVTAIYCTWCWATSSLSTIAVLPGLPPPGNVSPIGSLAWRDPKKPKGHLIIGAPIYTIEDGAEYARQGRDMIIFSRINAYLIAKKSRRWRTYRTYQAEGR